MGLFIVSWHDQPVQILGSTQKFAESENGLQVFCVEWTKQKFGNTCKLHHSANERLGFKAGALAKRMGQAKGFPDLIIYQLALGNYTPAAIEFKIKKNKLTPEQSDWLQYFSSIGHKTAVIKTFNEYQNFIHSLLTPARQGG